MGFSVNKMIRCGNSSYVSVDALTLEHKYTIITLARTTTKVGIAVVSTLENVLEGGQLDVFFYQKPCKL